MANPQKRELLELVDALFEQGLRSTTLLALALGINPETARRALIVLGKHRPRLNRADALDGLPAELKRRAQRYAARAPERDDDANVEVPHNSSHDDAQAA